MDYEWREYCKEGLSFPDSFQQIKEEGKHMIQH
jgi:hypothetical protein